MKRRAEIQLPPDFAPESLLAFLARRFTYHGPDEWRDRVERGRVTVNGRPAAAGLRLAAGDIVEYRPDDRPEPPVDERVRVVHEDGDLLVLDKSGNLPCHPAGAYFNHTLWAILKKEPFGLEEPRLVNRLDRETSGLVVVAKGAKAARAARAEFASRRVEKVYWTLVEGRFPDQLSCSGMLVPDVSGPVRKRRLFVEGGEAGAGDGEWAETAFTRISERDGISLVEARPRTGRLHQIRATLASRGFPVVGDKLYGVDPNLFLKLREGTLTGEDRAALRMDRQALHAARLRMIHPGTGQPMEWTAPLPPDMASLVRP